MYKEECPLNRKVGEHIASFCECWTNSNCIIHPKQFCYFVKPKKEASDND